MMYAIKLDPDDAATGPILSGRLFLLRRLESRLHDNTLAEYANSEIECQVDKQKYFLIIAAKTYWPTQPLLDTQSAIV